MSQATSASEFAHFALHSSLLKGIQKAGYETPRPIQAATLPAALQGSDILGLAQTGTGKTAGFAIPILQRIVTSPSHGPSALILAPTRELAALLARRIVFLIKELDGRSVAKLAVRPHQPLLARVIGAADAS